MNAYRPDKTRVPAGVAIVIRDPMERTYMIRRTGAHGNGKWSVPGGWISENDHSVEEAVIREAWEEVGITIPTERDVTLLGVTRDIHPEGLHDVCLWYRVDRYDGEPKNTNPERITYTGWADLTLTTYGVDGLFYPLRLALSQGIL